MLNDIKENPELLETFDDQCLLWWNKKDLICLIKDIVSKYFNKSSNTYNISIQFKMSLQSLIDNPKELLELINDCLKPKEVEKKENGEVFTPMILVNEMLDKLPKEVWKNKNLKWLDPCCGMGNFPIAVYLRLIEGLKDEMKDIKERKKHILENMLIMSKLNKKNVLVCKQIFDINNEYKLNIYEGDSLKVDYNQEFKIKEFDIIIGNPPYNASGTKASGNTIWQLFANNSIKLLKNNGYICFLHPNGWIKPNTVHSTQKNRHRFIWSNRNDNGFYGIKKIIFGDSGIYNPIIDIDGKYAMSEHAMAIIIDNIKEGEILSKILCSSIFKKILKACLWSSFAIDWVYLKT